LFNPLVYIVAVACPNKADLTCAGVNVGFNCSINAQTPATCGDAIEVPLILHCLYDAFK
jgi:broad specificity polyphosphatase/5'/3'-nucleotidase SurE